MATTPGGGGSGFITSGINKYASNLGLGAGAGGIPGARPDPLSQWDQWRLWFADWTAIGLAPRGPHGGIPPAGVAGDLVGGTARAPVFRTPEQQAASRDLRDMNRQRQRDRVKLRQLAVRTGVDANDPIAMGQLWIQAVNEAEAAAAVDPNITPWKILDLWARDGAPGTFKREETDKARRDAYFAEELDPYSVTNVSKNIQITDPDTARALVTAVLERSLGRRPSDDEIRDFVAALNKKERSSPAVTTTVENYAYDQNAGSYRRTGSESTTTGGAPDPGAFAQSFVEDEHSAEQKAYTAGVDYASVMEALIGSL